MIEHDSRCLCCVMGFTHTQEWHNGSIALDIIAQLKSAAAERRRTGDVSLRLLSLHTALCCDLDLIYRTSGIHQQLMGDLARELTLPMGVIEAERKGQKHDI